MQFVTKFGFLIVRRTQQTILIVSHLEKKKFRPKSWVYLLRTESQRKVYHFWRSVWSTKLSLPFFPQTKSLQMPKMFRPSTSKSKAQNMQTINRLEKVFFISSWEFLFSQYFRKATNFNSSPNSFSNLSKLAVLIRPIKVSNKNTTPVQLYSPNKQCFCILGLEFWWPQDCRICFWFRFNTRIELIFHCI